MFENLISRDWEILILYNEKVECEFSLFMENFLDDMSEGYLRLGFFYEIFFILDYDEVLEWFVSFKSDKGKIVLYDVV